MWLDLVFISGIRFFVVWMLSVFVVWCVLWSSHVEKGVVLSGWCVSRSHWLCADSTESKGLAIWHHGWIYLTIFGGWHHGWMYLAIFGEWHHG